MNIAWNKITTLELGSCISQQLSEHGIDCVLVGGACVTIYSENKYISKDLDFVTYSPVRDIVPILKLLGFTLEGTNRFVREDCPFYIEFLSYPVTIGSEIILDKFNIIKGEYGDLKIITPTDSVKDRLAAYYHWNDTQSLEQAILISTSQNINLKEIKLWSKKENHLEKFNKFQELLKHKHKLNKE